MSKLLIQESPLTFQPSLAVAIGLNEAIVLQQIHYWIANTKNKGYEQDGFKWVYNTYAEWKETNFPFWSENTVQRTFASLEEKGLVISIQPMKSKYDRTKYYRIDYSKLETFEDTKSGVIDDPKLVCSLNESENTTDNIGAKAPNMSDMPIDWQMLGNSPVVQKDQFEATAKDMANLLDMGCHGGGELALAFMLTRKILIPESKIKGNRKAAREMLQMGVKSIHVIQAVEDLTRKGMTITDLFSVSKTAIDLANKPEEEQYHIL